MLSSFVYSHSLKLIKDKENKKKTNIGSILLMIILS